MVQNYRNKINAQDVAMIAEIDGYHFHGMKRYSYCTKSTNGFNGWC